MLQAAPRNPPPRLWRLAFAFSLVLGRVAWSQESPVTAVPVQPSPMATYEPEDLARRLAAAEAKIATLEDSHDEHQTLLERVNERWKNATDPSIATVDQQTHGASTGKEAKHWYERLRIRGYAQLRHNTTLTEDGAPAELPGDSSVGADENFLIRRARLIVSGDVSDRLYVYLQQDFATSVSGTDAELYGQARDWYGDIYLDDDKVYRIRVGQSKLPYGWENMQSSSNRIPLDRSDAIDSAGRNQRDLGVMFYWTPEEAQDLFKYVLDEGLKGSGNYGVFALGVYNGQGGSMSEVNDDVHVVTRLAIPYQFANEQVMEVGLQAYTGKFGVNSAPIQPLGVGPLTRPLGTIETGDRGVRDERVGATFVWYPQPIGFQAEWNIGNGPSLNDAQTRVVSRSLTGGYAMLLYRQETERCGIFFPFARASYYDGGFKNEDNAPAGQVHEYDAGVEWQFNPQMELVTEYVWTDRTNLEAFDSGESYRQFRGQMLRAQFQINY